MKKENENKQRTRYHSKQHPMNMDEFGCNDTIIQPAIIPSPRKSRIGQLNPFFGHRHSPETKAKMSRTQKARYKTMRQNMSNESRRTHLRTIISEEVERLLKVRQN